MHNARFDNGTNVPMQDSAIDLGSNIAANGNQHVEIKTRILATLIILNKLNSFWTKSLASVKWKLRVYDAVIVSKLLY
eukprot:1840709-Heterocapsa_arctica.AAC.1